MATSGLKKSFVISSKAEAAAFVKMFSDSLKNPPPPIKDVKVSTLSRAQMSRIINARLGKTN